ncbi:autotransporter family protein [Desulfoluna spongiiphila]|uniref:autotransporter family protein n=1 Tax=Desulfoluna spongiiphila TaxID=419481 RepID=UPI0015873E5D|nr:autotransporter outer membrane beta-barrel domain-containing protein [Desulfoluna spongiiphila]
MKKIRLDWTCAGLLVLMVCGAGGLPRVAVAGEAAPMSPVVLTGTGNTEAKNYAGTRDLTLQVAEGAALNVRGGRGAAILGAGSSVCLKEGATVTLTTDSEGSDPVSAIGIDGDEKESENSVTLAKGAAVTVASTKATDTSAILITDADNAHVSLDAARVKASAADGKVYGVKLEKVKLPDTASLTMAHGARLEVAGKAAAVTGADGDPEGEARGVGIIDVKHGVVRLSGGSAMTVTASSSLEDADMDADGVEIKGTDKGEVFLDGTSSIRASAVSSGTDGSAYASGVEVHNVKDLTVRVDGQSTIQASGTALGVNGYAGVSGMEIGGVTRADVTLDGESLLHASATGAEAVATAFHLGAGDLDLERAQFTLIGHSGVESNASGDTALSGGVTMVDTDHGILKVAEGGHITATASATTGDLKKGSSSKVFAAATVVGMLNVDTVDVDLNQAVLSGTMSATAHLTEKGHAAAGIGRDSVGLLPVGIGALGYNQANIRLTDSHVTLTATASASVVDGRNMALVGEPDMPVCGILVMPRGMEGDEFRVGDVAALKMPDDHTSIRLTRSTIDVTGKASAENCLAFVSGITLNGLSGETDSDPATLAMTDSTVRASAVAEGPRTKDFSIEKPTAMAVGISTFSLGGKTTISLDNTRVLAEAKGVLAGAVGIGASDGDGSNLEIALTRGSVVKAVASRSGASEEEGEGGPECVAIALGSGSVTLDATSSLEGEWAVVRTEIKARTPMITMPDLTVTNKGLIAGRLKGVALDNASTGILQVDFKGTDDCSYVSSAAKNTFYFQTDSAKLADGSTFRILPNEGLGLTRPGQSQTFALLESGADVQGTRAKVTLEVKGNSPLLGLSWVDTSSDTELVARVRFLNPAEAGVSRNGGAAFTAALADMPTSFVLGTDPEAWSPSVNGAFLTGMTQTVGASHTNIGNRLGGLMGLNSGDEIVASGGLWYNASFTDADQDERDGVVGFDADTTGLSLGLDRQVGALTVGVAVTQGKSEAEADDNSSEMDMDDHLLSLYGSYDGGIWFGEAVLSAGMGNVDSVRRLGDATFTADYDSTSYNAMAKAGMKLSAAGWQVNPLLAVEYSFKDYDGYTESGGKDSGALEVESQDYSVFNVGGGATLQRSWVKSWGVLTPEVSALVRYDLKGDGILTTAKFVGGSTAFIASGADPAETSWDLSTALTLASLEESAVSLRLGYDYAGREDFVAHSVSGKLRFEF